MFGKVHLVNPDLRHPIATCRPCQVASTSGRWCSRSRGTSWSSRVVSLGLASTVGCVVCWTGVEQSSSGDYGVDVCEVGSYLFATLKET